MSLKKDRFNSFDKKYMRFAINLAKNQNGLTGTNPSVGCVIVKNKKIISYGVTNFNGRPHAEAIALNKNKHNNSGSSIYLTLEPCSHYGKTPPCTKAIIKSKVKKVYYSIEDTDLKCFRKSKKILKSKNIYTKSGLLIKNVKKLYKNYDYIKKNKMPYVIGKLACSSNLYILKNNKLITNEHSRKVGHLLRYKNQGILTSYKSINTDNPKLNCRINGLENFSPIKLIIDKDLKINTSSYIVNNSYKSKTVIFHNSKNIKKINKLKFNKIKLIYLDINKYGYIDFKKIFLKIYDMGIHNLLVESGNTLTSNILKEKLFNEFYLFKSSKNINNKNAIHVKNINKTLNKTFKSKKNINTYLDNDSLIHYY
jgi:diaminohydroxyphosphoribosylaminopyrimidine deaminase/5-amino-6-(5-phosphoribosylamino)uracil reductase